ncbi:hypothetical protein [Romboutsia weinsteinii]|nr:hypothetical protein [Romboutsia weinsteinii]
MKKMFKFLLGLFLISAIIALGMFVVWCVLSVIVVRFLLKSKGQYKSTKDFLGDGKNIIAIIAAVLLLVVTPIYFINSSKEYDKEQKIKQEQQAIIDQQKQEEADKKTYEKERANVLKAKSRLKKEIKNGSNVEDGVVLTDSEIEKYDIIDEEVIKFNKDVEQAIIDIQDENMAEKYKSEAKKYVKENIESSLHRMQGSTYEYNHDRTICTVTGSYKGKNIYGVNIRGEYVIDFDTSSGEMINKFIGNEKAIS